MLFIWSGFIIVVVVSGFIIYLFLKFMWGFEILVVIVMKGFEFLKEYWGMFNG